MKKAGVCINPEARKSDNSHRIFENDHRDSEDAEKRLPPIGMKEHLARENAGDEQS
jgi:hypothetical protein